MVIPRRELLKQILFVSAGSALIPACLLNQKKTGIALKHISITADQEALMASLADVIIPTTDTPGAKELHADLFVWKMLDDCTGKADQDKFMQGLNDFSQYAQTKTGKFFNRATVAEQASLLTEIEAKKDKNEAMVAFYQMAKRLTVQAYTSSEFYLTKVQLYEQIPGRFHGCVKA